MDPQTLQVVGLALAALNTLALPLLYRLNAYLWDVEKRLVIIETKLSTATAKGQS